MHIIWEDLYLCLKKPKVRADVANSFPIQVVHPGAQYRTSSFMIGKPALDFLGIIAINILILESI